MAASVKQYETGKLSGVPKLVIIWYRQNHPWTCFYCGALLDGFTRTRDHVVPRCNGAAIKDNTVSCCKPCNGLKSHVYVSHFRAHKGPLFWGEQRYLESKAYEKQRTSGGKTAA